MLAVLYLEMLVNVRLLLWNGGLYLLQFTNSSGEDQFAQGHNDFPFPKDQGPSRRVRRRNRAANTSDSLVVHETKRELSPVEIPRRDRLETRGEAHISPVSINAGIREGGVVVSQRKSPQTLPQGTCNLS